MRGAASKKTVSRPSTWNASYSRNGAVRWQDRLAKHISCVLRTKSASVRRRPLNATWPKCAACAAGGACPEIARDRLALDAWHTNHPSLPYLVWSGYACAVRAVTK